jgi:hypothetical protein
MEALIAVFLATLPDPRVMPPAPLARVEPKSRDGAHGAQMENWGWRGRFWLNQAVRWSSGGAPCVSVMAPLLWFPLNHAVSLEGRGAVKARISGARADSRPTPPR